MLIHHLSVLCNESCFRMFFAEVSLADQEVTLLRLLRTRAAALLSCGATTLAPRIALCVQTVQRFGFLMKLL